MGTVGRGIKSNGTTALADGNTVFAAELNTDFDTLYTLANGQIDNDNVSASAAIEPTKLNGYSTDKTEARTQANPGTSDNESLASDMAEELKRIRYSIWQIKVGTTAQRNDGSAKSLYWGDEPVRGQNLVRNSSFEVKTTGSTAAPDGWTLVGTPSSLTQVTTAVANGIGKALRVVSAGSAADGISQTFAGLKASTLYYVSARLKVNTAGHKVRLVTTGAAAGTEFRNIDIETSSTTFTQVAGMIITDATPTNIVVQILANADATADSFDIDDVQFREVNANIVSRTGYVAVRDSSTNTGAVAAAWGAFPSGDALSAAVTVPGPGYSIRVQARCGFKSGATEGTVEFRLGETPSTSGTTTYQDYGAQWSNNGGHGSVTLSWVQQSPVVGDTYTYSVEAYNSAATATANGAGPSTQNMNSHLTVELIPPG